MEEKATSSRLLVLVFTDLVGSTALKDARGHRDAIRILRQHQELVRRLVEEHGGEEIDNHGDGFFLTFERPTSAVEFALQLQNVHRTDPELPKLRIGIHQGEVEVEQSRSDVKPKDVWGMAVDVASRVCASALPDQILISSSVFNDASSFLSGHDFDFGKVEWTSHGSYQIRGASHPLSLCEAGIKGFSPMLPPEGRSLYREQWAPEEGKGLPHDPKWKLVRELGRGSFGVAWLARHGRRGSRSVFKFCRDPALLEDFKREMKALDVLSNTRADIARLIDYDFENPPYYLQLEYAPGGTLEEWADRNGGLGSVPLEVRLDVACQAFRALGIAHEVGVLHKDLKPSNILVRSESDERPQIQLADFGMGVVEKEGDGRSGGLSSSSSGRRVNYLAPELRSDRSAKATRESDVFSLGVVFYQLVVGDFSRFPEGHGWHSAIEDEILRQDLASCLTSDPRDRQSEAHSVAEAIERREERRTHLDQARKETFRRAVEPFLERLERRESDRRRRRLVALPFVVAVIALGGLFLESLRRQDERVLDNNQITARHVADNVRLRLDVARYVVNDVATRPELVQAVMTDDWDTTLEALKEGFTGERAATVVTNASSPPIQFFSWSFTGPDGYVQVREQTGVGSPYIRRDYFTLREEHTDQPHLLEEYRDMYETSFDYRDWFHGGRPGQMVSAIHVSEPFESAVSDQAMLAITAPVRHGVSGEILGVLLGAITLADMDDMLRSAGGSESEESELELIVINNSGQLVIHPDSVFEAVPPAERAVVHASTRPRLWDEPETGDAHFDGVFYQTPASVGEYGWTVIIRQAPPGGMVQQLFVRLRHGVFEEPWERTLQILELTLFVYLASLLLVPLVYTTVVRVRTARES